MAFPRTEVVETHAEEANAGHDVMLYDFTAGAASSSSARESLGKDVVVAVVSRKREDRKEVRDI